MARIFLETSDSARTANDNNDSFYGLAGDQVVTVKAKGITADAAVERLVFAGQMSDYTFLQSGPNAIKVMKGADTITTAFVQSDANGTQLTFANGTVNAVLGASAITIGGTAVGTTAAAVTPAAIDTTVKTPEDTTPPVSSGSRLSDNNGADNLNGTSGDDVFTAPLNDNSNSLENGDYINGGGGKDTLNAEIGNSATVIIQPVADSVENFHFQAQATSKTDAGDNFNGNPDNTPLTDLGYSFSYRDANRDGFAQIDAGKILETKQLWSDDSRANLVIEDVSVNSNVTVIGMRDTDPGNVNYEVYFDTQNIKADGATNAGSEVYLDILDQLAGHTPLQQHSYTDFSFFYGKNADGTPKEFVVTGLQAASTYEELRALVAAQLVNQTDLVVSRIPNGFVDQDGRVGDRIVITALGGGDVTVGTFHTGDSKAGAGAIDDIYFHLTDEPGQSFVALTSVDVILDNVARTDAAGSGDLVIGDMSESGIQQFNVYVDRSSHIDQLASTNNYLEVVNVTNDFTAGNNVSNADTNSGTAGANGDVRINTLQDVRVLDASTMVGKVNVTADLSENITSKYLDLKDVNGNPAFDNSEVVYRNVVDKEFSYDLGTNSDTLNLTVSSSNLAAAGTVNREDFVLAINGNGGGDKINYSVVADNGDYAVADLKGENWYSNSTLNTRVTINGGAGNDTIKTTGSGNVVIDAGADNDTVYADNAGSKAVFVYNNTVGSLDLDDLKSDGNDTYKIFNGKLTVNFQGFEATVSLPNTNGVVSDLQVNQAIKDAVNNNDVLKQLLSAADGPSNTLVVTSKIDGEYVDARDLEISIAAPTTLSAADVGLLNQYYGGTNTEAALLLSMGQQVMTFTRNGDYLTENADGKDGAISAHTSDNHITGGTGNDVIVLGTGANSNDTVAYVGFGNGTDSIVHFDDSWTPPGVTTYTGKAAVAEVVTLTFGASDGSPVGQTINFDGTTVTLSAPVDQGVIPAADVAYQFATQFVDADWIVSPIAVGTNRVTLTRAVAGDLTDVTAASFTGTYVDAAATGGGGSIAVQTTTQGSDAIVVGTPSTFTVAFDVANTAANAAGSFVFDGVTVNYAEGDGAITLASKLEMARFLNWDVANNDNGSVTFTALTPGATAIGIAADFDLTTNTIVGTLLGAVGTANVGTPIPVPVPAAYGPGYDIIDFSSYDNTTAVLVDNRLVEGVAATTGQHYVLMTENIDNRGEYTISLYTEAGATDTLVNIIGIADFGDTQSFHADNFIV